MPVQRGGMLGAPAWCELDRYEIVTIGAARRHVWTASHPDNKLVVGDGTCTAALADGQHVLQRGSVLDVPPGEYNLSSDDGATVVTLSGRWGPECGGTGVFTLDRVDDPADNGDPAPYPKNTAFDRHYHDCDEYWILLSGRGTVCTENAMYEVGPGDCVATRRGQHHDFPLVDEHVTAVFFETTLQGRRRLGHLWEHTHGPAIPAEDDG